MIAVAAILISIASLIINGWVFWEQRRLARQRRELDELRARRNVVAEPPVR